MRQIFQLDRISAAIRATPLGILLVAASFAMIGMVTTVAGFYLMIEEGSLSLWAGIVVLVIGPTIMYLSYHLVRLSHWAWMALVCLSGLLLLSSVVRLVVSPSPVSPTGEIVVELLLLFYLTRPKMRASFGRVRVDEGSLSSEG